MFEKIKRLSAEYRKHEKEMSELKLKQIIESGLVIIKTMTAALNAAMELAMVVKNTSQKLDLPQGGIAVLDSKTMKVDSEVVKIDSKELYNNIGWEHGRIISLGGVGESRGERSPKITKVTINEKDLLEKI